MRAVGIAMGNEEEGVVGVVNTIILGSRNEAGILYRPHCLLPFQFVCNIAFHISIHRPPARPSHAPKSKAWALLHLIGWIRSNMMV